MQYLADAERNISISKIIYKARGKTLDVKLQKRWKYSDMLCSTCKTTEESGENPENYHTAGFIAVL